MYESWRNIPSFFSLVFKHLKGQNALFGQPAFPSHSDAFHRETKPQNRALSGLQTKKAKINVTYIRCLNLVHPVAPKNHLKLLSHYSSGSPTVSRTLIPATLHPRVNFFHAWVLRIPSKACNFSWPNTKNAWNFHLFSLRFCELNTIWINKV